MKKNDLTYYLSLIYDLVIRQRTIDGSTEYMVFANELEKDVFYGVGCTIQEAIESFHDAKSEIFELYIEKGLQIPEPRKHDDCLPSGRFLLRTSPKIHRDLIKCAKENKQSLNAYVNAVLQQACTYEDFFNIAKRELSNMSKQIKNQESRTFNVKSKKLITKPPKTDKVYKSEKIMQAA